MALLFALLALTGCSSALASPGATGRAARPSSTGGGAQAARAVSATPRLQRATKVLVVIEENHSLAQMRRGMPYLATLSERYGYATDWRAVTHPSEPNYIAIAGGSTFGIRSDADPATNARKIGSAPSVFSQARRAGKTAGTFAQSMPTRCALRPSGPYAVKHNPWAYFAADRAACRSNDRSTSGFDAAARANRLPNVGFLVPDLDHDAHDGTLRTADSWLKARLSPVLASSDFRTGRLVVIVTADEDDRHSGNRVLTSVLTPALSHKVARGRLTHYSLTRYIAQVLGVRPLGNGRTAPDLKAAFGL